MEPQSDAEMFENGNQDSLDEVLNGEVPGGIEAFDDPSEGERICILSFSSFILSLDFWVLD